MPITGTDRDDMLKSLEGNWRLENGTYTVEIVDVNLVTVSDGRRPLCWDLYIQGSERRLQKYHWIDREGGVNILLNDLESLGAITTPELIIDTCNNLIGSKIEVSLDFDGEFQNISFLRILH
ncbi:hypothetical protein ACM26V_02455 [Salipaludibacillus sp. HK11]|uniref:hypothetical protein n=1 Tax=Salipaludibacillus sp. HK11 TaxID=3394320 RepID=UPI0039FDB0F1